ncbi:MAG TPA: STAS domain-containing protein [Acidimicrobiales bacterium]|nr:STAS domain-containing protein [Acidimicrobiales bacterium]
MIPEADFEVSDRVHDGVPVMVVHGEIDVATAPQLRERLLAMAEGNHALAVADLSGVTFMDSTALGVLVSGVKRFRSGGGDLRLVITEPHIAKVFAITGLDDLFSIYPSAERAISA